MAQHKHEHRDAYIAAIVGGVAFVLILLYLYGGQTAVAATSDEPLVQPTVDGSGTPDASNYNYNVAPYDPGAPIQYAFPTLFNPQSDCGCGGSGVGGIPCGPVIGANFFDTTVAQYQTLATDNAE